jgi:hypothetical protein
VSGARSDFYTVNWLKGFVLKADPVGRLSAGIGNHQPF